MKKILLGVEHCHKMQVMHRDLKPQNILISQNSTDGNLEIKISDFGLARKFTTPQGRFTKDIATLWYRAPEIMLGDDHYTIMIDTWAIGCIFVELITKRPPFQQQCQIDQIFDMFRVFGTPNETTYPGVSKLPDFQETFPKFQPQGIQRLLPSSFNDPQALDLLTGLLSLDPYCRFSCTEALKHPYFNDDKN